MHKIVTAIAALLVLGIAHAAQPGSVQQPPPTLAAEDLNAWLDGYLPYALHTADIAGAVVAVVKDGQILTERGYGYSDVDARTPVDPKLTLFRPGSVSKLVTWTAVMQLVEQGKIDLDAGCAITVSGFLNLHGQDHPLKLTVNLQPKGTAAGLTTHFTVPFVAWGLKDPSSFIFRTDKEVILDVDAIAIHEGPVARAILRPGEMHTGR